MLRYRNIECRVVAAGGVMQVTMEELRECEGVGKLGVHVLGAISRNLAVVGLAIFERRLPNDQRATVWLISSKTDCGKQVAVTNPCRPAMAINSAAR